jgi:DNA-binding phage protein
LRSVLRVRLQLFAREVSFRRDNATPLHPRNSNLALTQFVEHRPRMADFLKELRKIQRENTKAGVSLAVWADAAGVSRTTLWRILERGQTPSVNTYLALVKSADSMAEKKIASAQK